MTPEPSIDVEAFKTFEREGYSRVAHSYDKATARNPFFGLVLGSVQKHGDMNVNLPAGPPLFHFGDVTECESALRAAGFTSVSVTELPMVWPFSTPEDVAPAVVASTARIGPILAMQTPEQRRNIESAIAEGAKKYVTARGVEIPMAVLLAVGQKP